MTLGAEDYPSFDKSDTRTGEIVGYHAGHSRLFIRTSQAGEAPENVSYLCFSAVNFVEGFVTWTGASLYESTDEETSSFLVELGIDLDLKDYYHLYKFASQRVQFKVVLGGSPTKWSETEAQQEWLKPDDWPRAQSEEFIIHELEVENALRLDESEVYTYHVWRYFAHSSRLYILVNKFREFFGEDSFYLCFSDVCYLKMHVGWGGTNITICGQEERLSFLTELGIEKSDDLNEGCA
jgi:hypothetical protein